MAEEIKNDTENTTPVEIKAEASVEKSAEAVSEKSVKEASPAEKKTEEVKTAGESVSKPENRSNGDERRPANRERSNDRRPQQRGRGGGGRRKFFYAKKVCKFSTGIIDPKEINYKNVSLLKKYVMPSGKIVPRRITGTAAKYQHKLAAEIKKARILALLPFVDR